MAALTREKRRQRKPDIKNYPRRTVHPKGITSETVPGRQLRAL